MLQRAPYEIVDQILAYLKPTTSNNDLLSALHACKALSVCAFPILYRDVVLRSQRSLASFSEAIKRHGSLVRRLGIEEQLAFDGYCTSTIDIGDLYFIETYCRNLQEFYVSSHIPLVFNGKSLR